MSFVASSYVPDASPIFVGPLRRRAAARVPPPEIAWVQMHARPSRLSKHPTSTDREVDRHGARVSSNEEDLE